MAILEHIIETYLAHLQALLEQIFASSLRITSREFGGVICTQCSLNTLESGSWLIDGAFAVKVLK
jgi:hypothetical protein